MVQSPVTKIEPRIASRLSKQRYQLVGEHGGVKVCHWTKQSLIADRSCYKGTFYGIESHGCMQMAPNVDFLVVMQANYASDAKLLIGCQVGGRSARAAQLLAAQGYTDVVNVKGGFGGHRDPATGQVVDEGWAPAGLPVKSGDSDSAGYEALRTKAGGS